MSTKVRYRWFRIKPLTAKSLASVARVLQVNAYADDRGLGYRLQIIRKDRISGELIRRREYNETVEPPFGESLSVHRIVYESIRFSISLKEQLLVVENPGALTRALIEDVAGATDYSVEVSPCEINPLIWLEGIKLPKDTITVSSLKTVPFSLSVSVSGIIRVTGSEDVLAALEKLPFAKAAGVSQLLVHLQRDGLAFKAELRSTGLAVIHKGNTEVVLDLLSAAIRKPLDGET